ncbi:hypothetical protein B9479_004293 [Cryptococcus floricola]|uniref:Uncharacterized protein n=1 Tax=Cryptococcus floricola TaxID=2591691 RepID=A0A5D3AXM4_9TREE|nr:hypothetical protein B9479_004293 [Cryptococcus floricola]
MPGKASKGKFSSNDDPKQTKLEGWFIYTPSSAASQPSSSNLPADANPKRAATSSLAAHSTTAKKSRVDADDTKINPPAREGAQRPPIASAPIDMTNDEIDFDSDSDSDDDIVVHPFISHGTVFSSWTIFICAFH